jgi:hypothetical protein
MENNSLDKFIRKMLADLDGGDPGDTWSQLNEKLDKDVPASKEDADFDDRIKASLMDINAMEMSDWENFAPSLELAENLEHLDQDMNIDASFKENLEDLNVEYDPSTWDALSTKLDLDTVLQHEHLDKDLDQIAYDSLLNYTVPQRAGDWEALEEKLEREPALALPLIYKYKLVELAILTLLILVFFQAKPLIKNNIQKNGLAAESITSSSEEVSQRNSAAEKAIFNKANRVTVATIASSESKNTPLSKAHKSDIDNKVVNKSNLKSKASPADLATVEKSNTKVRNTTIALSNEPLVSLTLDATPIINGKDEQVLREVYSPQIVATGESEERSFGLAINTAELPVTSLVNFGYDQKDIEVCGGCFKPESILRWRIGAHLDAKYDYIMTAYDKIFNLESYNHHTFSYGAGLSTSILLGRWELESGFDYATREYETKIGEIIGNITNGYLKVRLDKIQMNVLSVPLNLRYHFKDEFAKAHFYVHAGATMNVATHANYFIKSEFLNNTRRPNPMESNNLVRESNIASDKIYSLGWFEGGTYLSNRYFYANLGMGFERKISSRYSIFGQTTYSHFLDNRGIGPNDDRFNSLSFSTGIRALFK